MSLAIASYSILVAVMLLTGRLVVRDRSAPMIGLASMILVGTTSLMLVPATWYSAGKADSGLDSEFWRHSRMCSRTGEVVQRPALVLAMISAVLAGWFWADRPPGRPGGGNLSLGRRPAPMSDRRGMAPRGISDRGDVELGHRLQPL